MFSTITWWGLFLPSWPFVQKKGGQGLKGKRILRLGGDGPWPLLPVLDLVLASCTT